MKGHFLRFKRRIDSIVWGSSPCIISITCINASGHYVNPTSSYRSQRFVSFHLVTTLVNHNGFLVKCGGCDKDLSEACTGIRRSATGRFDSLGPVHHVDHLHQTNLKDALDFARKMDGLLERRGRGSVSPDPREWRGDQRSGEGGRGARCEERGGWGGRTQTE